MLMSYGSVSPDLLAPGPGLTTLKSQFMETEAWHSFIQVSFNFKNSVSLHRFLIPGEPL